MARQINFEWQIDEEEYDRAVAGSPREASLEFLTNGERRLALIVLRMVTGLLIILVTSAGAAMPPDQMRRIEIEDDVRSILQLEQEAWRGRDRDRYDALIDPSVDAEWVGEWRDNWGARGDNRYTYTLTLGPTRLLDEDLIQADVYVTLPRPAWWQTAVRRETRFYRGADEVWLRTLPPESYWGEPLRLATSEFVFHYYEADAEAVHSMANRLDAAYTSLFHMLGLGSAPEDEPKVVVVKPGIVHSRRWGSGELVVTSPLLAQIPDGLTDDEYLADRLFSQITNDLLRDRRYVKIRYDWAFVTMVLRGWLVHELLDQPNPWREESREVFRSYSAGLYPLQLADLDEFLAGGETGRDTVLWRYEAVSSLLDYVAEQYGAEALPALLEGFAEYGYWKPLIEDVFETPESDFTAGWNSYLAAEYELDSEAVTR